MPPPAAILSVEISDNAREAAARLTKYDAQLKAVQDFARKGIETRLGATLDPAGFDAYQQRLMQAAERARDRQAFKAELGANFNNAAFNAYERAVAKAKAQTDELNASQQSMGQRMRSAAGSFFTGSRGANGEERSFFRGTLRGSVGRGAGFIGSGLAGGLLGYVSASGIKSSIDSTTQMVKQAEALAHYTGMSAQSALQLEAVSKAYGASSKQLGMGFRTLATQMNTALSKPTQASTEAFRQLGISQDEVKAHAKDLSGMFGLIADKLNAMPAGAQRTADAAKLLGRNWQQLAPLLQQGAKGIADQEQQAKALGVTLGGSASQNVMKLHEAEVNLSLAQQGLSMQFTEHVAPALIKVTEGAIKLGGEVRRDLTPVFRDLSPVVKDVGHWLEQNKGVVEGLAIAYGSLKIIRTVGGWMGGLYSDGKRMYEFMRSLGTLITGQGTAWERLTGFFRAQQSETQQLTGAMNELAASIERVSLAQRGLATTTETTTATEDLVGGGLLAKGGGFLAARAVPGVAAAYMLYRGLTAGTQYSGPGGLASLLGPTSAWTTSNSNPSGMHMSWNFGDLLSGANPFGGHFMQVKEVANSGTQVTAMLSTLRNGLKNVTSATQLTDQQLNAYYGIVQKLSRQPDLTATQRKGLAELRQQLNPTTVAFERATAQWSSTFAGFDATSGSMSRNFRDKLRQDSQDISRNWTRGTKQWTTQVKSLISAAWTQIQSMSDQGVKGVGRDIEALLRLIAQADAATLHMSLKGVSMSHLTKNAPSWLKGGSTSSGGGWNLPAAHHAARHATAQHMEFNPFTGRYQMMTSAEHQALRDRYIIQNGVAPPSSPHAAHHSTTSASHLSTAARHAQTLARERARRNLAIIQRTLGYQSAGGAGNQVQVPSQAAGFQVQMQQIQNALQQAQNSNNTGAQDALLNRQIRLDNRAIGLDQGKLRAIVKQLHGALTKARRSQLMQDKLQILQDIGTLRNDIGSAMSQLQNVAGGSSSSGQFDLAPGGAQIRLPTVYDVRHSLLPGRMAAIHARHPGRNEVHHHHHHGDTHNTYNIKVEHERDIKKVEDAIDRSTGSQLHARMRAAGMRGT